MKPVVPFLSQSSNEAKDAWLNELIAEMPDFDFVDFGDLSPQARAAAEVAVVANPNPNDLHGLPNLKWVQSLWAGVETLLGALPESDLKIVRLVDPSLSETMSEAVLTWTLYLHREMHHYHRQQSERVWLQRDYIPATRKKVGILGMGHLGRASAQRLVTNGFDVLGWSRTPAIIDGISMFSAAHGLEHVLSNADIVVVLLPLTPATRGLLGFGQLGQMKQGACLINFGRGPIVDTQSLITLLDEGHLDHAVLDVFDEEPLSAQSLLWDHPGITILPHIAAPTNKSAATKIVAANLRHFFREGTIPPSVNRVRGY